MSLKRWPRWLRWLLVIPLALLAATVVFLVYGLVSRLVPGLSLELGLPAVAIGSAAFVYGGRIVAPNFNRQAGGVLAVVVLGYACYSALVLIETASAVPQWYAVIMPIAAAAGAVYACFARLPVATAFAGNPAFAWMPNLLRAVAFLPIAAFLAVAACFVFGTLLALLRIDADPIRLAVTPIAVAVFVAAATAVAPSRKRIVAAVLGALTAVAVVALFSSTLHRTLVVQASSSLAAQQANGAAFHVSIGYQLISLAAALIAVAIVVSAAFENAR